MVQIRTATVEDAAGIAAVHVRGWQHAYRGIFPDDYLDALSIEQREKRWLGILAPGGSPTWVAEEEGRILGWGSAGACRDADGDETTGELWALYVDPDAWRRGIGRAIWKVVEAHLRAAGYRSATLWVLADNHRALQFYHSLGFQADGHEKLLEQGGASIREVRLRLCLD